MLIATIACSIAWVLWCSAQLGFALVFQKANLPSAKPNGSLASASGKTAILLAVRGSDPSFASCLKSLLAIKHPNFEVHIVVDSNLDPAITVIDAFKKDLDVTSRLFVHVMKAPLKSCSLKCSALIHGLKQLSQDTEYLVTVDSDVTVHSDWLNHLLAPFSDPEVGVVTGNQWFEPIENANVATVVRSIWNAGAMVPAVLYGNTWAGSMAMRKSDFDRAGLLEVWSKSIVDDGPISGAAKAIGKRVQFVPELMMINTENCKATYVHQYVRRMLTWGKLYDPTFALTIGHAIVTGGLMLCVVASIAIALITWNGLAVSIGVAGLLAGAGASTLGYFWIRSPIVRTRKGLDKPMEQASLKRITQVFFLTNVTQLLYVKSLFGAVTNRTIHWRGAIYTVNGPSDCQLEDYKPFEQSDTRTSII